jgi:hypothetical protein
MGTKLVYVGIIIMILVLSSFSLPHIWSADAQQQTRRMLEILEQEGKKNCEVWQINDFLYTPVRINIVHEAVDNHQVSITSEGGGEAFWDGSAESFQMVARDTDRYTAEIILDYETKHEEPRQVFYQIISGDRILMMEGNWVHEGFTFCKIIDFFTDKAPTELTEEEIIEINNKFNADFREEQASSNTTIETGILILAIVVVVVGILVTLYFIIIIIGQRSMSAVTKRPEKKLNMMIEKVRKQSDVLTLVIQSFMATNEDMKKNIIGKINDSLRDLSIMAVGTKNKIELENSFPSAESLVPKNDVSTSTPVENDTTNEEQQKLNEEVYEKQYKAEKQTKEKEEITFVTLSGLEEEEKTESKPEPKPELQTIEVDITKVKPCVYCGKAPMYICIDCNKTYCEEHESHKCTGKEKKSLGKSDLISEKISSVIKSVMEKKNSATNDDVELQKMLDKGKTKNEVKNLLMKEYMKIPYKEARVIYDKMVIDYDKNKTFPQAIRNEAMMERLVRSDT